MTNHRDDYQLFARVTRKLPPVVVTHRDHRRLRALLADSGLRTDDFVVRFLRYELDRAVVCRPAVIPPNIITMNSRVFFRRHSGQPLESRTLVYHDEHWVLGGSVSIMTPLGVALLGLCDGAVIPYRVREGTLFTLIIEKVAYQPEREGCPLPFPHRDWPRPRSTFDQAEKNTPGPDPEKSGRTVVPLAPRPRPVRRPTRQDDDDDPGPNRAA